MFLQIVMAAGEDSAILPEMKGCPHGSWNLGGLSLVSLKGKMC